MHSETRPSVFLNQCCEQRTQSKQPDLPLLCLPSRRHMYGQGHGRAHRLSVMVTRPIIKLHDWVPVSNEACCHALLLKCSNNVGPSGAVSILSCDDHSRFFTSDDKAAPLEGVACDIQKGAHRWSWRLMSPLSTTPTCHCSCTSSATVCSCLEASSAAQGW